MSEPCDNCKELQRKAIADCLSGFVVCDACTARQISEDSDGKHMLIRDIGNCARCGEEHVALIATRFERPFARPRRTRSSGPTGPPARPTGIRSW